jgi:multiple sugar transport system ATP-binding protein
VSKLQKRLGTTMVYVTHDQTEAMTLGDRLAVMRSGILQQVGSPHELYDNPVNLFVAGFIGSPAMNFMAGTLEEGSLRTTIGSLPLNPQLRQALERANAGRQVIVGIRPENFEDASLVQSDLRAHGLTFRATIDVVESMGSDVFVYFTQESGLSAGVDQLADLAEDSGMADSGASEETVTARLDPATGITEGQNAELWADLRSMHIFDPDTGKNLSLGTERPASAGPPAN